MVVPLRPGKFYGSSLPRPRIYTDVKLSDERVDPPLSVLDPLMSWAYDAHWSMGGLSFKRLRLQGKIEGNAQKLRKEREKTLKKKIETSTLISQSKSSLRNRFKKGGNRVDSPPPAPISKKRRQRMVTEDEEDDEEIVMERRKVGRENGGLRRKRRRLVRKLGDDFESVASDNGKSGRSPLMDRSNEGVALRTRSRRSMVLIEEENKEDDNGGKTSKAKKGGVENGKSETIKEKNASVSPNGGKVSVSASPVGSRSSPRLKQRTN